MIKLSHRSFCRIIQGMFIIEEWPLCKDILNKVICPQSWGYTDHKFMVSDHKER